MWHRKSLGRLSSVPPLRLVVDALSHYVNTGREVVAHSFLSAAFVSADETPGQDQMSQHPIQLIVTMWLVTKQYPTCLISLGQFPRMRKIEQKKKMRLGLVTLSFTYHQRDSP